MQKRKNIRLLIIFAALLSVTVASYMLLLGADSFAVQDNKMFALDDVSQIDRVVIEGNDTLTLHFGVNDWLVNDQYTADPQRLTVLFAILNQVRARRPIADAEAEKIDSLFKANGREVFFYEGGNLVRSFAVAGNEDSGMTYFRNDEGTYIVSIPGYRSFLAGLFNLPPSGWRYKLIFDEVSWNNLENVEIQFPHSDMEGFSIGQDNAFYDIKGMSNTDSLKILDYLDRVSLLMAERYMEIEEAGKDSLKTWTPIISISIRDIRNEPAVLQVLPESSNDAYYTAIKDSTDWLIISKTTIDPLLRPKSFFRK